MQDETRDDVSEVFDARDGGMSLDAFLAQPLPIVADHASVARAVRYMRWWLSIEQPIGAATKDSIAILMRFAEDRVTP